MSVERRRRKANERRNRAIAAFPSTCPNCGRPGQHFVPPSLGDRGFYVCDMVGTLTRGGK